MAQQRKSGGTSRGRTPARRAAPRETLWTRHRRDVVALALGVLGVFVALAEADALGPVGRALSRLASDLLGVGRVAVPAVLVILAIAIVWGRLEADGARLAWGAGLAIVAVSGLGDIFAGRPALSAPTEVLGRAGGWLGVLVGGTLARAVGDVGAVTVLVAVGLVAAMIATGLGLRALVGGFVRGVRGSARWLAHWWSSRPEVAEPRPEPRGREADPAAPKPVDTPDPVVVAAVPLEEAPEDAWPAGAVADDEPFPWDEGGGGDVGEALRERAALARAVPTASAHWDLPPLSLLARSREQRHDRALVDQAGDELVEALANHGVATTLVGSTVGPTVTRYELELGPGVKVARVTSLNRDIAYALATPDVRILAPIPGRSAIGIEVPNRQRTLVALGDLLSSDDARAATHPLDVPIGRDIEGETVIVNLGEMPHVLISGATGAGKSSCINSLVMSLVMRATPEQVRLLLVDPKRVEMGHYQDLPHLLAPVVVDPKKAAGVLAWAVKEMERRYDRLAEVGVRDISGYHALRAAGDLDGGPSDAERVADAVHEGSGVDVEPGSTDEVEDMPYVVIVVDELNDLMMVAARDVEDSVVRIAQMARAVGIHLVLATQRPSVDVITGVIKANVPSRMAFAVSSLADSRVILDQAGAERLIGKGDMLLLTASSNVARRIQSPWVAESEIQKVVEFWRAQGGRAENVVALEIPTERGGTAGSGGDDDDDLLAQARELVIRTQSGSTSMLQRKLRVGFARAGRLMDLLEQEGVVGPGDGSKARRVLVGRPEGDQAP